MRSAGVTAGVLGVMTAAGAGIPGTPLAAPSDATSTEYAAAMTTAEAFRDLGAEWADGQRAAADRSDALEGVDHGDSADHGDPPEGWADDLSWDLTAGDTNDDRDEAGLLDAFGDLVASEEAAESSAATDAEIAEMDALAAFDASDGFDAADRADPGAGDVGAADAGAAGGGWI